jgi:signal peptidase II
MTHRNFTQAVVLALALLGLDQLTKQWVVSHYGLFQGFELTGFLNIVRVHNPGAAFSFLAHAGGWQQYFFTALAFVVSAYLLWLMWRAPQHRMACTAMGLIVSGAIGNVIDRLRYGYVIDFIDLYLASWHWPAFNVADSCICVGAALLVCHEWRSSRAAASKH